MTTTQDRARSPKGSPDGGQFAPTAGSKPSAALTGASDSIVSSFDSDSAVAGTGWSLAAVNDRGALSCMIEVRRGDDMLEVTVDSESGIVSLYDLADSPNGMPIAESTFDPDRPGSGTAEVNAMLRNVPAGQDEISFMSAADAVHGLVAHDGFDFAAANSAVAPLIAGTMGDRRTFEPAITAQSVAHVRAALTAARDAAQLDQIATWLQDPDWGVGMLEDIADRINTSGRVIYNPQDVDYDGVVPVELPSGELAPAVRDEIALDAITAHLTAAGWSSDTLDEVRQFVVWAGRDTEGDGKTSTWGRH
jgi:hypothetical protein